MWVITFSFRGISGSGTMCMCTHRKVYSYDLATKTLNNVSEFILLQLFVAMVLNVFLLTQSGVGHDNGTHNESI